MGTVAHWKGGGGTTGILTAAVWRVSVLCHAFDNMAALHGGSSLRANVLAAGRRRAAAALPATALNGALLPSLRAEREGACSTTAANKAPSTASSLSLGARAALLGNLPYHLQRLCSALYACVTSPLAGLRLIHTYALPRYRAPSSRQRRQTSASAPRWLLCCWNSRAFRAALLRRRRLRCAAAGGTAAPVGAWNALRKISYLSYCAFAHICGDAAFRLLALRISSRRCSASAL